MGTNINSYFLQVSQKISNKKEKWILDRGCSKHMTGHANMLTNITSFDGVTVSFGDNSNGYVIGKWDVSNLGNTPLITKVLLVENLKRNLLSISQLCDKGFKISFEKNKCSIYEVNNELIFEGIRNRNIYILDKKVNNDSDICLVASINDPWLWHKRFCHINFKHLNKLSKHEIVKGLPRMNFKVNNLCDDCQKVNLKVII